MMGQTDDNGIDSWNIRSIDELVIFDDRYRLREVPMDPQGVLGWVDLDPATTFVSRMWVPDARFSKLATSPMRALLDVAEELLLLSRDVRASARSRLAGGGILKIPEGLRMESLLQDNQDPESEDWFGRFAEAMMTPLADEGVASAVVPIMISGEPDSLAQLEHILIERPYSALAIELRAEAIGRIAVGLDLPREILEGVGDVNHWNAALVGDDTFRHHIEPQIIEQVDSLTIAYLRPWLLADGFPQYWVNRACIWYNPADLISKPDPMANATLLHDRYAISNEALRKAGGFDDSDSPSPLEIEFRMLQKTRTFPPNMVEAIFHAWDPSLEFPPINVSGTIPGIGPEGEIAAQPPAPPEPGVPALPIGPTPGETGPPASGPPAPAELAPPSEPGMAQMPAAFAAVQPNGTYQRQSRRLAELDAQLRIRIQVAANAAMTRLLDRSGAKLRTKVADRRFKNETVRAMIDGVPNRLVASTMGEPVVAAVGFASSQELLNPDWSDLEEQFKGWTRGAQSQALKIARQLAKLGPDDKLVKKAKTKLSAGIDPAWAAFEAALNTIAENRLYNPDPNADEPSFNPNTIVPLGTVRQALSIAGGAAIPPSGLTAATDVLDAPPAPLDVSSPTTVTDNPPALAVSVDIPAGQIGTGDAISGMLADSDNVEAVSYEWIHGAGGLHAFEPHEDLDGVDFTSFTDDALANTGDWPENDYYFPGDHDGCSCDYSTTWGPAEDGSGTPDATGGDETAFDPTQDTGSSYLSQTIESLLNPTNAGAEDLTAARAEMIDDIKAAGDEASGVLDRLGMSIKPPQGGTGGEYDWYKDLSTSEKDRLRNNGYTVAKNNEDLSAPDQVLAAYKGVSGDAEATTEDAMSYWLQQTRVRDGAQLLVSRGRLPADLSRFGNFDWNNLAPGRADVSQLFTNQGKAEAAQYLATQQQGAAYDLANSELTAGAGRQSIYSMSFSDYDTEVSQVLEQVANAVPISTDAEWGDTYSPADDAAFTRLNELLPASLVGEDTPIDELNAARNWAEAQAIARSAGLTS
jgi:hypothetical protein